MPAYSLDALPVTQPADAVGISLPIQYGSTQTGEGENAPPGATDPPTVTASAGRIDVLGLVQLGNPCFDLDAGLQQTGPMLLATVRMTQQGGGCIQVLDLVAYRTWMEGLARGTYQVVIEYVERGSERRRRVEAVTVSVS